MSKMFFKQVVVGLVLGTISCATSKICASEETFEKVYNHSSFGSMWTSTFNFQFDNIRTGVSGNVNLITEIANKNNEPPTYNEPCLYDLDYLHQQLKGIVSKAKEEGNTGSRNLAVGGVTVIFNYAVADSKNFLSVYVPITSGTRLKSVFVSGFLKSNKMQTSNFQFITTSSEENSDPKTLHNIHLDQLLQDSSARKDKINKFGEPLPTLYNHWMYTYGEKNIESFLQEQINNIKGKELQSLSTVKKGIKDFQTESEGKIGSVVDSEQLFLNVLRNKKIIETSISTASTILKGYLSQDINETKEQTVKFIKDSVIKKFGSLVKDINNMTGDQLNKELRAVENQHNQLKALLEEQVQKVSEKQVDLTPTCINLHMHTTRELCKYCAASLSCELMNGIEGAGGIPVFLFVSASEEIETQNDSKERPCGIYRNFMEANLNNNLLDFSSNDFYKYLAFQMVLLDNGGTHAK